jgi:3D (Asp-Asp-Asp) domain-containing protein
MKLRWYIFAFIAILALVAFFAFPAIARPGAELQRYSLYVVTEPGTAEDIAAKMLPGNANGAQVLAELNGLETGRLMQPGDILTIPDPEGELTEPLGPTYSSFEAATNAQKVLERALREARTVKAYRGVSYKEYVMEATAYTNGPESTGKAPGHPLYGITATGLHTDIGAVAVDPAVIPLGSAVWVEGYGYAVAVDVGGAIRGMRIDVFMHDVGQALEWGRRQVKVRMFE